MSTCEFGSGHRGLRDGVDKRIRQGSRLPRKADNGAYWDREIGTLGPDRIGGDVVVRGGAACTSSNK